MQKDVNTRYTDDSLWSPKKWPLKVALWIVLSTAAVLGYTNTQNIYYIQILVALAAVYYAYRHDSRLIILTVLFLPLEVRIPVGSIRVNIWEILVLVFYIKGLWYAVRSKTWRIRLVGYKYWLLFVFASLFSIINAVNPVAVITYTGRLFEGWLVFVMFYNVLIERSSLARYLKAIAASVWVMGVLGIIEFVSGPYWMKMVNNVVGQFFYGSGLGNIESRNNFVYLHHGNQFMRAVGFFNSADAYGLYMGMATLMFVGLLLVTTKRGIQLSSGITILLGFVGVILSLSKAALISSLLSLIVLYLVYHGKQKRLLTWIGALTLGVLGVTSVLTGALSRYLALFSLAHSESERLTIWRASFTVFLHHPIFGVGGGNLRFVLQNYLPNWMHQYYAHSSPLNILAETGVVGALACLLLISNMYRQVSRMRNTQLFFLAVGGLVVFTSQSMVDVYFTGGSATFAMFLSILALGFVASRTETELDYLLA